MRRHLLLVLAGLACAAVVLGAGSVMRKPDWSADELKRIQSLSLANLPALRPDPSNRVADDPAAAALGKALFFDTRLSANGAIACASCHQPDRQFQDDLPVGHGMADGTRRTMPIAGTAYFPFLFWDGRKDSQWSQALGPLENPVEHGADRTMVVRLIARAYKAEYEGIFGPLPRLDGLPEHALPDGPAASAAAWGRLSSRQQQGLNLAYANIGKAIAAFERTIAPQPTRFDAYASALAAGHQKQADGLFGDKERAGLKLFIGQGNCVSCHNGPLFTDNAFHNVGLPGGDAAHDSGRSTSVAALQADPFNCLGAYSDAEPSACTELKFMATASPDLVGAFRSPSLRGVALRAPFTHAGQFATLHDLLAHYNKAPKAGFGSSELKPLELSEQQLDDLEAFVRTLNPEASQPGGE
ncbi:cytochrome-c peroxidase [Pseudaminobacter soli (ex Li et al. 2025)]|uniref:Methylamine utilization protein n=1 Tax=Pseudaminobacter soli (ex Li et al. 2025) TaxID=1295366 RepID=A0A2P7S8W9_9HYPH|nr:cytochrome c peroxidase [Mesorhizobium soli]PSJ58933.1 methylamine utilization protein [Mesorhizobium soli]